MRTMRNPVTLVATVLVGVILLAACGQVRDEGDTRRTMSSDETPEGDHRGGPDLDAPPPVTINFSGGSIELVPWTYCYGNGCADGMPPETPPDVGDPEEVIVEYPLPGWSFEASFTPAGEKCARDFPTTLEQVDEGSFLLRPAGYRDTYDVTLFGRGDGDLFVTFRWSTPSEGPLPAPEARLAVLADHDGEVDSYGVELALTHLAETPKDASATITVRAVNGEEVTFQAKRARGGCRQEGTLYWDGPDDQGLAAAQLPGERFTYEVEVQLDGERYAATATWPDDVIEGNEPSVRLDFRPDLPALD